MLKQYARLWNRFKTRKFTFTEAKEVLKEKNDAKAGVVLSRLAKAHWIEIKRSKSDRRVKEYWIVKNPESVMIDLAK